MNHNTKSQIHPALLHALFITFISSLPLMMLAVHASVSPQDVIPPTAQTSEHRSVTPAPVIKSAVSTIVHWPGKFQGKTENKLTDDFDIMKNVWREIVEDEARGEKFTIVHVGDSHVKGGLSRSTKESIARTFPNVHFVVLGINGATSGTHTKAENMRKIVEARPKLLIVSLGTNECHGRNYASSTHRAQLSLFYSTLRTYLPDVPILFTTPPGAYLHTTIGRGRKARTTYVENYHTNTAAQVIVDFARSKQQVSWNLFQIVGGRQYAIRNWWNAGLMRPDHVHYLPEGYTFQGDLLFEALMKSYNQGLTPSA